MKIGVTFGVGILLALSIMSMNAFAQPTEFTYQGSLDASGSPANGNHDFQFALFDAATGGAQLSLNVAINNVPVTNGIFTVNLNFPSLFPGADRFLEVRVRPSGVGSHVTLTPRSQIRSAPYSIKSANSDNATNAQQLAGVAANQYVLTGDARMTDARNPLPGGADYIQNQNAAPQATSNFNISGTGSANVLNAATQFNLGGSRILSSPGGSNLFAGPVTGSSNTGTNNSFFGSETGSSNTTGSNNSFYGRLSGISNLAGAFNSFFGSQAGLTNSSGSSLALFGFGSGLSNTTGSRNSFFGNASGSSNATGSDNTIIGAGANVGANNLTFATAIGAGSTVSASNRVTLGRPADLVQIPGSLHVLGSTSLQPNSIASAVIVDEPGVASSFEGSIGTVLSNGVHTLLTGSINVPSVGYVLVLGKAEVRATHTNGAVSTVTVGVSTSQTTFGSSQDVDVSFPASAASGTYESAVSVHHVFLVTSAGTHNFHLLARGTFGSWSASEHELTLVFFPTSYGTVERPENASGVISEIEGVKENSVAVGPTNIAKEAETDPQRKEIDDLRLQLQSVKKLVCLTNPTAEICKEMK